MGHWERYGGKYCFCFGVRKGQREFGSSKETNVGPSKRNSWAKDLPGGLRRRSRKMSGFGGGRC